MDTEHDTGAENAANTSGWMLIGGAILFLGVSLLHPQVTGHALNDVLGQMRNGALVNGWVHGLLMALYLGLLAGYVGFSRFLGTEKPLVVLAMTAYLFGAIAMMGAGIINGFTFGILAERYATIRPDQIIAVGVAINALGSLSGAWAGVGAVSGSLAIALWSAELLRRPDASRAIAVFGIAIGIAATGLLVSGMLILNVHGFILLTLAQSLWTIAAGSQMLKPAPDVAAR